MSPSAAARYRLKRREDISRLFEQGRRASGRTLTIRALPNGLSHSRVGVAVSSRHGGAVVRNRLKRVCREAARQCRAKRMIPDGYDIVLTPAAGREASVAEIAEAMEKLIPRVTKDSGHDGPG